MEQLWVRIPWEAESNDIALRRFFFYFISSCLFGNNQSVLTCKVLGVIWLVSVIRAYDWGSLSYGFSSFSWGRLHDTTSRALRVASRFWHGGHMSISQLCIHSILAFLQRYILRHMPSPFAWSLELFWHGLPPSMLHWIVSLRARYSITFMMGSCWLGMRSPLLWLSHMCGIGSRLYWAGSSS